ATIGAQSAQPVPGGKEFQGLQTPSPIPAGKTTLTINFTGKFSRNDVEGLFAQTEAGNTYVYTQFEPTSARRAFPCFDEPQMKVPWKLTLRVPPGMGAFSNTPQQSEATENGLRVVKFNETKPLPSYLVALAVGPFDVVDGGKAGRRNIPVRAIVMKGRAAEAAWANKITPAIIAALEEYFGQPYPYEKLDQVAIPITVGFGAMENAGLITYQQTILLSRPEDDTLMRQRQSAGTITHELAHQWFGNMVTPAWWDDIWLNEAFATWMANKINGKLHPEWNSQVQAVNSKAGVMSQDQLVSSRKVRQPIEDHGDIGNAFDGITYQKGGAVIRMFENYVGSDKFQKGVQAYMRKHMWGNATASDFLDSISQAAGRDIRAPFSQYLDRGGLPLLTVELKCDQQTGPKVAITQERSLPLGSTGNRNEFWPVPVCLRWEADGKTSRQCVLITDPKDEIALRESKTCPTWLTANDQGTGYYHILYKGDLAAKLQKNPAKLSVPEKVDMLRNAQALVKNGRMPASDALALAREFRLGPEREVLSASKEVVESVRRSVPSELTHNFGKMIREFYGEKAHSLGWAGKSGEDAENRLLRPGLLEFVATLGEDKALATEARKLTMEWLKDRKAVQPEMVSSVLRVAAWHGDKDLFEALLAEAKKSKVRRERQRILDAIGNFRDSEIAKRGLNLMLTGELDVRELTGLLMDYQENPETRTLPWEFVTANYDKLLPRLPTRLGVGAGAILPVAGASFCSTEGYSQVQNFFEQRIQTISGGQRSLAKTLESIQLCEARVPAQQPDVARFLKQYPAD
ncbi:MAG: M1 family aminopeptidase, partial [Bryobacteraceae bacterium]|nr:M1 family aminopeptidase [Bryobacteraceae bacterium]